MLGEEIHKLDRIVGAPESAAELGGESDGLDLVLLYLSENP